jgi:hypothetical protein
MWPKALRSGGALGGGRLGEEARLLHGALDHGDEGVGLEGLGEVVLGAELDGLDGAVDGAERRHHHHHGARRSGARLLQQPDAVEAGHLQVGEDQVGPRTLPELAQRLEAVGRGLGLVALLAEDLERAARALASSSTIRMRPGSRRRTRAAPAAARRTPGPARAW